LLVKAIAAQFVRGFVSLGRAMLRPKHQALAVAAVLLIVVGVVFYSWQEGWSVIDSLYFSVIALTTVGFGDLAPASSTARLFTVFYVLFGVGLLGAVVHAIFSRAAAGVSGAEGDAGPED
jgi:hypothetical protein